MSISCRVIDSTRNSSGRGGYQDGIGSIHKTPKLPKMKIKHFLFYTSESGVKKKVDESKNLHRETKNHTPT